MARPTNGPGYVANPPPGPSPMRVATATAIAVFVFATGAAAPWIGYLGYDLDLVSNDLSHARDATVRSTVGVDLRAQAVNAAIALDNFLVERIIDARQFATTPKLVDAAREAGWRHEQSGLTLVTEEEVEALGGIARSRSYFPDVDAFLRNQMRVHHYFRETSVTDANGFNAVYSNPTSRFVHSDEGWWKVAWSTGLWIGIVGLDSPATEPTIEIAVQIVSPTKGERLGVLKASIDLWSIQELIGNETRGAPGLGLVVFASNGRILAETASEHAADRILDVDGAASKIPDRPSGYTLLGDASSIGFARTAGAERYASVGAPHYAGLEWLVTSSLDSWAVNERRASFDHLVDALARADNWPGIALVSGASSAIFGALAAFFMVWRTQRRIAPRVRTDGEATHGHA